MVILLFYSPLKLCVLPFRTYRHSSSLLILTYPSNSPHHHVTHSCYSLGFTSPRHSSLTYIGVYELHHLSHLSIVSQYLDRLRLLTSPRCSTSPRIAPDASLSVRILLLSTLFVLRDNTQCLLRILVLLSSHN